MNRKRYATAFALVILAGVVALLWAIGTGRDRLVPVAYVASAGNNHVQVIDLESGRTLRRIYAGTTPWRLRLSPDGRRLWVQHWYSATTAVVDRSDHEIERVLPVRGPGEFTPNGREFVSFSWPGSAIVTYDAQTLDELGERLSDVRNVYDLAADRNGQDLYLAQFDPMTKGPRPRYGYVLRYPRAAPEAAAPSQPVSLPTGKSPAQILVLEQNPFLLTVDRESNGLTLINERGARRSVPACGAPRSVAVSEAGRRMVVVCWEGRGVRTSHVISYDADFAQRPWPSFERRAVREVRGGLVSVVLSESAERAYAVDRTHARLLGFDSANLELEQSLETGDVPVDVVVTTLSPTARDRLAASESRAKRSLKRALAAWRVRGKTPQDLSWVETTRWAESPEESEGAPSEEGEAAAAERTARLFFRWPDSLRSEASDGTVRLSQGGHSVSISKAGRFWVTPRQELLSTVIGLAGLPEQEALRVLAGDVAGSPFLRGGIAIDVAFETTWNTRPQLVVGALEDGGASSQLWLDRESGRPTRLFEQFPAFGGRFRRGAHAVGGDSQVLESRLLDFERTADYPLPRRIERWLGDEKLQEVSIDQVRFDPGTPEERFALSLLGGVRDVASPGPVPQGEAEPASLDAGPGRAIPILAGGYLESPRQLHAPYNSVPPTSGPRLDTLADWGVHATPIPLELQVHNLEHGGVGIQYRCDPPCPDLVSDLEALASDRDDVFVAPLPFLESRIALTAWGRLQTLERFDRAAIERFIDAYGGRDHRSDAAPPSGADGVPTSEASPGAARLRETEAARAASRALARRETSPSSVADDD